MDAKTRSCLVGANLAFRRRALERLGPFSTEFQRVRSGVGSLEDHEMLIRCWQQNLKGMYLPALIVTAEVEPERMAKAYHRKWHTGHGRYQAMLRTEEMERSKMFILGVPSHLYRQALKSILGCMGETFNKRTGQAFAHEMRLRFFAGFVSSRWREFVRRGLRRDTIELKAIPSERKSFRPPPPPRRVEAS